MKTTFQQLYRSLLATTIHGWLALLVACCALVACTDQLEENKNEQRGEAIRLNIEGPDQHAVTRAADAISAFPTNAIIHITTVFTLSGTGTTETVYSCMKYDGKGNWTEHETSSFKWPWNATKASFTAYYIPAVKDYANTNQLAPGDLSFTLTQLTEKAVASGQDPFIASIKDVEAGSAVHLQFRHLFAKLTLVNLEPEIINNQILRLIGTEDSIVYNLAANNELTYKLETRSNNYIQSKAEVAGSTGSITFLLPQTKEGTSLKIAHQDYSAYHTIPLPIALEAGKHYKLDVQKLADNFISDDMKENDWNNTAATEVTLNGEGINAYLTAIRGGKIYIHEAPGGTTTQVLDVVYDESIGKNIVIQLVDVNFNNNTFNPVNIGSEIIFNANNHKIRNLKIQQSVQDNETEHTPGSSGIHCASLFGKNEGTIKGLVIEGAQIALTSTSDPIQRAAILVGQNDGTISNVKVKFNNNENLSVKMTSGNIHAGALVGLNTKTITNCTLSGNYTIEIDREITSQNPMTYVGGFVGQSDNTISNSHITGSIVKITVEKGGDIYIGGFAGKTGSTDGDALYNCSSTANISITDIADMTAIRAGGITGTAVGTIKDCVANGKIKITPSSSSSVNVYAGAAIGLLQDATIDNCQVSGTIDIQNITDATKGGLVGWLAYTEANPSPSIIINCSATGDGVDNGLVGKAGISGTGTSNKNSAQIKNSFCNNKATVIIPNTLENEVTITNCHCNGTLVGGSDTGNDLLDKLQGATTTGFKQWTNIPDIYGSKMPYLIH